MNKQISDAVAALQAADLYPHTTQLAYGVTLIFCAIDDDSDVDEATEIIEKFGIKIANTTSTYCDTASFATFTISEY